MFLCDQWRDYEVLDTGEGEKLERWGDIILRRPDPQVIWPKADPALWDAAQATYVRSDTGGGHWEFREKLPERWVIGLSGLKFYVKPTGFKHTGLFPELSLIHISVRQSGRCNGPRSRFAHPETFSRCR